MESNLQELDFKRYLNNFSDKYPVKLLMDTDASYISAEAMKILDDEKQTADAVEQYMELFSPLIDHAIESFCAEKEKTPEEVTDEDLRRILECVTTVMNEDLLSAVMQGQQFTEIIDIVHNAQAHEDFSENFMWTTNTDAINFHNQWTHCRTLYRIT